MLSIKVITFNGEEEILPVPEFMEMQYLPSNPPKEVKIYLKDLHYSMGIPSEDLIPEELEELKKIFSKLATDTKTMNYRGEITPSQKQYAQNRNAELKYVLISLADDCYLNLKKLEIEGMNLPFTAPTIRESLKDCIARFSKLETLIIDNCSLWICDGDKILDELLTVALSLKQLKVLGIPNNHCYLEINENQDLLFSDYFLCLLRFLNKHQKLQTLDLRGNSVIFNTLALDAKDGATRKKGTRYNSPEKILPAVMGGILLNCPSLQEIDLLTIDEIVLLGDEYPRWMAFCNAANYFLRNFPVKRVDQLYEVLPGQKYNSKTEEAKYFEFTATYLMNEQILSLGSEILQYVFFKIDVVFINSFLLYNGIVNITPYELISKLIQEFSQKSIKYYYDEFTNKKDLVVLAAEYRFNCHNVPGDGNCMFHALLHQLQSKGLCLELNHSTFRKKVVSYIGDHPDKYEAFLAGTGQDSIQKYLDKMKENANWGDELIFAATSELFGIRVLVLNSHADLDKGFKNPWLSYPTGDQIQDHDSKIPTIIVGFDKKRNHYQSLISKDPKMEQAVEIGSSLPTTDSSNASSSGLGSTSFLPGFTSLNPIQEVVKTVVQQDAKCDKSQENEGANYPAIMPSSP